jgi:hypothetical protein
VHLVEIDVVCLQPAKAVLDLTDDPPPGVAKVIRVGPDLTVELGGEEDLVARPLRALPTIVSDSPWL